MASNVAKPDEILKVKTLHFCISFTIVPFVFNQLI